ncbi:MAG: DUF2892 domain-containing protein [Conexibacteraceae bacterium]|nr:DUF2892 domain-containing protein [Conexibacteraceae bacterium]
MFVRLMGTHAGRGGRIAAGAALIAAGIVVGGVSGTILVIVGLVPLLAGAFNVCLVAPLFGLKLRGGACAPRRS